MVTRHAAGRLSLRRRARLPSEAVTAAGGRRQGTNPARSRNTTPKAGPRNVRRVTINPKSKTEPSTAAGAEYRERGGDA